MYSTTEITSKDKVSDNPIHQRLIYAYMEAAGIIGGQVLELGCGSGRGLELVLAAATKYLALDKNSDLISQHQVQYPEHQFQVQHMPPLEGLAENTFDFVISFQVIEHIEDDDLFVKEIYRVLKPGGQAIITTPNIKLSLTRNPWHVREYTAQELETLMKKYFSVLERKGVMGNDKVMAYYEQNKKSVEKITRFDIFNLQYRLPRWALQIPYEILNRMNRNKLHQQNTGLVAEIDYKDYFITEEADKALDFFYIATK